MFSALPSNSDIARRSRHVSKVPGTDMALRSIFYALKSEKNAKRTGTYLPFPHPIHQ
jgi:hypothetical protein